MKLLTGLDIDLAPRKQSVDQAGDGTRRDWWPRSITIKRKHLQGCEGVEGGRGGAEKKRGTDEGGGFWRLRCWFLERKFSTFRGCFKDLVVCCDLRTHREPKRGGGGDPGAGELDGGAVTGRRQAKGAVGVVLAAMAFVAAI